MAARRVVVTGLGMVSPVGNSVNDSWSAVVSGKSGIAPITHFDVSAYSTRFGGGVKDFDVTSRLSAKEARKMDVFIQYGMYAGIEAIEDSGLEVTEQNAARVGAAIGSGIGGIGAIENTYDVLQNKGPRRVSPFFVPGSIVNMIAGDLSVKYGFQGPNLAVVTACTTGTHNIAMAARLIQAGDADAMIAGGSEMATTPVGLGGFAAARALSTRNDDPTAASRPWDKDRDGFVLSDGAGVLVLEEYEFAKARGAQIYAELIGVGMSGDAYHMTSPPPDGAGAAASMRNAIADAKIDASSIDYINAHGTSTLAGDVAECLALKTVLKNGGADVAVSSTKSMTGHLLGAAGAVEAIFSILAIRDGVAPPTINLDDPDDACDFNLVPHVAQQKKIACAMSNSFGFGGTNGTVIFRAI
ncbi:beta-ketoacyl-ACP synthase II [Pseudomonadales bacterium]|nr:beta-ketoacyl-ACP synthase II [Pseudomonadales bacterium]MDB4542278.1 beta-ketoacyl-ACP synthase II [Pseudomonadales bacterium]